MGIRGPGGPRGPLGPPGAPGGPWGGPGGPGGPWGPWGPWAHGAHGAHGGPMGPNSANVPPLGKTFFRKSTQKSKMSTLGGENQSCSRRNSAHFGTHTVLWGPLIDSFPDFQFCWSWIQDPGSRILDPGSRIQKIESPGNCHLRVPTRRYGYQNVQNFGANNFGFHPQS